MAADYEAIPIVEYDDDIVEQSDYLKERHGSYLASFTSLVKPVAVHLFRRHLLLSLVVQVGPGAKKADASPLVEEVAKRLRGHRIVYDAALQKHGGS